MTKAAVRAMVVVEIRMMDTTIRRSVGHHTEYTAENDIFEFLVDY